MSFFTMHDTCVKVVVESEIYEQNRGIVESVISGNLNDIGAGKVNYLEMTPAFHAGQSRPTYGSFVFFVRYYTNLLIFHWTRDFDIGTCQWKLETKGIWECPESANIRQIRLLGPPLRYDSASGKVIVQSWQEVDDQNKKVLERCK
jgi:hypothetical protein